MGRPSIPAVSHPRENGARGSVPRSVLRVWPTPGGAFSAGPCPRRSRNDSGGWRKHRERAGRTNKAGGCAGPCDRAPEILLVALFVPSGRWQAKRCSSFSSRPRREPCAGLRCGSANIIVDCRLSLGDTDGSSLGAYTGAFSRLTWRPRWPGTSWWRVSTAFSRSSNWPWTQCKHRRSTSRGARSLREAAWAACAAGHATTRATRPAVALMAMRRARRSSSIF